MLGEAIISADVAITGDTVFHQIKSLRFTVEEDEMLVDLKAFFTASHDQIDGYGDFTLFLDSGAGLVDMAAPLTNGLLRKSFSTVADQADVVAFERTLRLAKGEYRVSLQGKVANLAHTMTVEGTSWKGWLTANRHSHPATLAQAANSKAEGIY